MDEEIQQSIQRSLDHVNQLKINKDSVKGGWKAYRLQSEIFRHFAMIDWMTESLENGNIANAVKNEVASAKQDAQSEPSDLKQFPVRRIHQVRTARTETTEPFQYTDLEPQIRKQILSNLTTHIVSWYAKISSPPVDPEDNETCRRVFDRPELLLEYLREMPNLRSLVVNEDDLRKDTKAEEEKMQKKMDAVELPDLQHLKYLGVSGSSLTLEKFLTRYAKTVKNIDIGICSSINSNLGRIHAPRLSRLTATDSKRAVNELCLILASFEASPLKVIILYIKQPDGSVNFPSVMTALNKFGGTLEDLTLDLGKDFYTIPKSAENPTWVSELKFPKMRRYSQIEFAGSWTFLLRFPHLEELKLAGDFFPVGIGYLQMFYEHEDVVELSMNLKEMRRSNIWKLLPRLKKLIMRKWFISNWKTYIDLSRAECINV